MTTKTKARPAAKASKKEAAKAPAKKEAPAPHHDGKNNPLASSALLVCVEVHMWGNRRLDKKISDKTAEDHKAESDMLRTWKRLIGKEAMKQVTVPFSRYKSHHYENTVPWLDNGYRMLPSRNYLKYVETERKLREECMAAVDEFLKEYPKYRTMAQKQLGTAFSDEDYPEPGVLRSKWRIVVNFAPVPDKADFRVDIPAEELKRIGGNIEDQVQIAMRNANRDLFERLYKVVVSLRDRLKAYKVTERKGGKKTVEGAFRESAITNIVELCDLLPSLNVGDNAVLEELRADIAESFGGYKADQLKDDEELRAKTIKKADDILQKMADYITA